MDRSSSIRGARSGRLLPHVGMLLLGVFSIGCARAPIPTHQRVRLGGEVFRLELAATDRQRTVGMMGREAVAEHGGMLFVFPDVAPRSFWMKNCLIPLDVVFLDEAGRIVSIRTMSVPPPDDPMPPGYPSRWPAQFAIELEAGRARELGLERGERIELPLDSLKRLAR